MPYFFPSAGKKALLAVCFWVGLLVVGVPTDGSGRGGVGGVVSTRVVRGVGSLAEKETGGGEERIPKACSRISAGELWMVELGVKSAKLGFPTEPKRSGGVKWRKNEPFLICSSSMAK